MDLYHEVIFLIRTSKIKEAFALIKEELLEDDDLEYLSDFFNELLMEVDRLISEGEENLALEVVNEGINFLKIKDLKQVLRLYLHKKAIIYRDLKESRKAIEILEEESKLINSSYIFLVQDLIENEVEYVRNKLVLDEIDSEVTCLASHAVALIDDDNTPIDDIAYASLMYARCLEKEGNPEAKNLFNEALNCYYQVASKDLKNLLKELKEERLK